MELDKFDLMTQLRPYDRWVLECMYDGPIPIEAIKGKLDSYQDNGPDGEEEEYLCMRWGLYK